MIIDLRTNETTRGLAARRRAFFFPAAVVVVVVGARRVVPRPHQFDTVCKTYCVRAKRASLELH